MTSTPEVREIVAEVLVIAGAGVLAYELFVPQTNELLYLGVGLLLLGLVWLFVVAPRPLRLAAGLWLVSMAAYLGAVLEPGSIGPMFEGPSTVSLSEVLLAMSGILAILALVGTLRTFRTWLAVALIGWMIAIAIAVIYFGGSVRPILCEGGENCPGPSVDLSWEAIWIAGSLVLLAVGLLGRRRDAAGSPSA